MDAQRPKRHGIRHPGQKEHGARDRHTHAISQRTEPEREDQEEGSEEGKGKGGREWGKRATVMRRSGVGVVGRQNGNERPTD